MAMTDEDLQKLERVIEKTLLGDVYMKKVGEVVNDRIFQALDQMLLPEMMKINERMVGVEGKIDRIGKIEGNHEERLAL